jgi:hypothetical protein
VCEEAALGHWLLAFGFLCFKVKAFSPSLIEIYANKSFVAAEGLYPCKPKPGVDGAGLHSRLF